MIRAATRTPGKDQWKETGIKADRYELKTNDSGIVTLWLDGNILPYQKDIIWNQKMEDTISITVTVLFG